MMLRSGYQLLVKTVLEMEPGWVSLWLVAQENHTLITPLDCPAWVTKLRTEARPHRQ